MKRFLIIAFALAAISGAKAEKLHNPVIGGFHPDPSVCRVGDDFYLATSSFHYFPGVPMYHSRDLVNWELIGNVLNRDSQLQLPNAHSWIGIYAPTLRYHDGVYYMVTTNVGNGGNFFVTATSPEGPWSEPKWLKQGGIDPSFYFEDGKCYFVSNPDNTITLCEIDPKTGEQLTPSRALWRGTGGRYPEGPHIYKKDGMYYLLIAEGGTDTPHHLSIARSRDIYGPYEQNPANPILDHCNLQGQHKQIQATGHGDFIQAADGSWWLLFLAYRNMGGTYHHIGRETYLAPVEWREGEWPVVNGTRPIDNVMDVALLPQVKVPSIVNHTTFKSGKLGHEWVYIQNPVRSNYVFEGDILRLKASESNLTKNKQPTFVGRRQEAEKVEVETSVTLNGKPGAEAGLSVYQNNDGHYDLCVVVDASGEQCIYLKYEVNGLPQNAAPLARLGKNVKNVKNVKLHVSSHNDRYYFSYSLDGKKFTEVGNLRCNMISTEVVGGFTGVVLGMYATGGKNDYADFSYFDYFEK